MQPGDFAFWKHHVYPYLVGDEIVAIQDERVITKRCGPSYPFTPMFTLEPERGRRLVAEIQRLAAVGRVTDHAVRRRLNRVRRRELWDLVPHALLRGG
ncbi:hypothetical protein V3589_11365 [Sinorhizobium fredii]|uniref:hypothetical protein n=1 Tax=Rhizobium fredii TaxID=380 RepID=UPI00309BD906